MAKKSEPITAPIEVVKSEEPIEVKIPGVQDPNWTEYVLSLLRDDEKVDNRPVCDGLRRIFEALGFKIINAIATPIIGDINGHAVVQFRMDYLAPSNGQALSISEVASCSENNTEPPFNNYPYATAATMAEGRALRKALRLNIISREEMGKNAPRTEQVTVTSGKITEAQTMAIKKHAERLKFNLDKLVNVALESKDKKLGSLTNEEALVVIKAISMYERGAKNGGKDAPADIMKE